MSETQVADIKPRKMHIYNLNEAGAYVKAVPQRLC